MNHTFSNLIETLKAWRPGNSDELNLSYTGNEFLTLLISSGHGKNYNAPYSGRICPRLAEKVILMKDIITSSLSVSVAENSRFISSQWYLIAVRFSWS